MAAGALLFAAPGTGPRGNVLDVVSNSGASGPDAGQAPAGGAGTPAPVGASPSAANLAPVSPLVRRDPMRADRSGPSAPPVASLSGYVWPIAHPRLTLPFGPTGFGSWLVDGQLFHDGVDLATFCGDRIDAAHAGTVLAAGRHYDEFMGWLGDLAPYVQRLDAKQLWTTLPIIVVIDDGNGYRSIYAHFSRIVVKAGEIVRAGQLLGYEGMTGRATGCHLHYGLFSPFDDAAFTLPPDVAKRMKLPALEIARVDPLLVLPPKPGINAPATPSPMPLATPPPAP